MRAADGHPSRSHSGHKPPKPPAFAALRQKQLYLRQRHIRSPIAVNHGTLVQQRGRSAAAWHWRGLSRRRHPRGHQGAAAIRRELCRRLSGRAGLASVLAVIVEAKDLLAELGVHVETCTNEAAAAAMLGASINYPLRGAVTWKSIVGTNVAADALSNLASPGVIGGALIVLGEDYGEGASVIQERSYAYAMKSSIWLLDPRPELSTIVHMVEKGFDLSEASHAPVRLDLRVRACHVPGGLAARDNRRGRYSAHDRLAGPPRFDYSRLSHPPVTFTQERLKIEQRLPAAQRFIREQKLNEVIDG